MMKISAVVLLLAALGLADAKSMPKSKAITKKNLLRNFIRLNNEEGKRHLENQDGGEDAAEEEDAVATITAYNSIKFQQCLSLTIGPSDETAEYLFDEDLYTYTRSGELSSAVEVVLFNICDTGDCTYSGDPKDLLMIPLASWIENTFEHQLEFFENYCDACLDAADSCQQEDGDGDGDGDGGDDEDAAEDNAEDDGEESISVDCGVCYSWGCFKGDEEDNNGDNGQEEEQVDPDEFITTYMDCQPIEMGDEEGQGDNNQDGDGEQMSYYASWCCNEGGAGIQLCLYLDQECSVKFSAMNYKSMMYMHGYTNTLKTYDSSTKALGGTLFYPMSCGGDENDEDGGRRLEGDEDGGASEFCQALAEEGGESLSLSDCGSSGDEDENGDENNQDERDLGDEDYFYLISAEDAEDFQTLCLEVQSLQGVTWETQGYDESTAVYDESDYDMNSASMAGAGLTTGAITAIAAVALVAGVAIGAVAIKYASVRKNQKEEDPKEFHLVDEPKVTIT